MTATPNDRNPALAAASDSLPFRRLLSRDHASDRELEDRSAAVTNLLLLSAYKRVEGSRGLNGAATAAAAAGSWASGDVMILAVCCALCMMCTNAAAVAHIT
jgi:hypothetical protein